MKHRIRYLLILTQYMKTHNKRLFIKISDHQSQQALSTAGSSRKTNRSRPYQRLSHRMKAMKNQRKSPYENWSKNLIDNNRSRQHSIDILFFFLVIYKSP